MPRRGRGDRGRRVPRPALRNHDFVGWEGGVPLLADDGSRFAAAFSGFRGIKDIEIIEIIERAAARVGLQVKRD